MNIASGSDSLAIEQYKDAVGKIVYWELYKYYWINSSKKWHQRYQRKCQLKAREY